MGMPTLADQQQKRMQQMEQGALAGAVEGAYRHLLEEQQQYILRKLIVAYRSKQDALACYGCAAELSALDELLSGLQTTQRISEVAKQKELR